MITCFPDIYEDELFYSYLARAYERSGFIRYRDMAEEMFTVPLCRPTFEFIAPIKPTVMDILKDRGLSTEIITIHHTMFPYYARFMDSERKLKAYDASCSMAGDYYNLLSVPKSRSSAGNYARYCPLCAVEDRERYGETYWHRKHQMPYVSICPKHGCRLIESALKSSCRTSPGFATADSLAVLNTVHFATELDIKICRYIDTVMWEPINLGNNRNAGLYLHSKLQGTKYLSRRGEKRNNISLLSDYQAAVGHSTMNTLTETWQLVRLLTGYPVQAMNILLVGFFLGVSEVNMADIPEFSFTQTDDYDAHIIEQARMGVSVEKIAKELGCQRRTVFKVLEEHNVKSRYSRESVTVRQRKRNRIQLARRYWIKMLRENPGQSITALIKQGYKELAYLRRVDREWTGKHMPKLDYHRFKPDTERDELYCKQIWEIVEAFHQGKPVRVCKKTVGKKLGITGSWKKYPDAETIMTTVQESWEEYWARKVEWAIDEINCAGKTLSSGTLKKTTNLKNNQILASLPYLDKKYMGTVEKALSIAGIACAKLT